METVDYLGNATTSVYNERNYLLAQYDELGNLISENVYDDNGRQISATDALGNTISYTYDADGNVVMITNPQGDVTKKEYDMYGNVTAEINANGYRTEYVYDARNRLVGVQSPAGEYNAYAYDNAGNLVMQSDGAGNRIAYTFNVRNLEVSRQDIGTAEESLTEAPKEEYVYRADGKLSSKVDRNGVQTAYTYDGLGRLISEKAGEEEKQYTYDLLGKPISMMNGANVTLYGYDAENRIVSKTVSGIGTTTYQYDIPIGNGEVKEVMIAPDGAVKETVYDAVGRIKSVSAGQDETVHYVYNPNGSRQAAVYADGTREDYTYDNALHVSTLTHTDRNGNLLDYYEYFYDAVGNLTEETNRYGTTRYTYDANGRIESVTEPEGRFTKYTYDLAGNRATKSVSLGGEKPEITEYTYNSSNYLVSEYTDNGKMTEYTYDANGNLISEECTVLLDSDAVTGSAIQVASVAFDEPEVETSSEAISGSAIESPTESVTGSAIRYTYDAFNRLTQYETDDVLALYSYNAEDYRVGKTILDDSGIQNVLYFYEGSRVIMETDGSGTITAHNLYGTNLISRSVQGESYYYLYNAHGDVVMLMDTATGAIAATYRYDAFGNVIAQTGNPDNSITYAGYQYDEESGLYYLNARYYDSSTARFLTEDTYRGNYSDPLSLNRYTYCHNNPIIYTDPSGHSVLLTCLIFFVSGAILGGTMEIANQKLVQQRDEIDWTAVLYEAVMSGGFMALGAGQAQMALKSAQMLGQVSARLFYQEMAKTGAIEFIGGFMTDTGRQIIVEQRSFEEMDFGRSFSTGIWSGLLGMFGFGLGNTVSRKIQEVKDVFKQATKHADDAIPSISTYANILSDGQTGAKVPRGYPIVDDFIPVVRGSEVADDVLKIADGAGDGIVVPGNQENGGSTNLFRVMSEAEYESVMINGKFVPYDRAMEEKWFATSQVDAMKWADIFYPDGNYRMLEIEIDTKALSQMYYNQYLDNIGPAYCAPLDVLESAIKSQKGVR